MPTDPRKRQKKLESRAAKRKSKQHQLARAKHAGLPERLVSAANYPILHSLVTSDLWDQGLGWICLSRELPNGMIAFAIFLVDRYCLGVKNAMADVARPSTYESRIVRKMRSEFASKELSPAAARKFIEGAVEYARNLGFSPHPDYQTAKLIFGAIDVADATETLEFGKDGKPFFIGGPNDTPARCRQIVKTLEQSCGAGRFDYLVPVGESRQVLPESFAQQSPRPIDPDDTGTIL